MPGLHIYTSNRLEQLAEELAKLIDSEPLPSLQQETIVVQSRGMEHWLCLEIARHNGICANISFPFPRAFVLSLFSSIAELPDPEPFDPGVMTFRIMKLVPQLLDLPEFKPLKDYLGKEDLDVKLLQISEKIATVYDQYLIYRPDMMLAWDRGDITTSPNSVHTAWQVRLWQSLVSELGDLPLHPASLKEHLIQSISSGRFNPSLLPRVSVFGISTLPPYYLEIFAALAQAIDVFFFYLNPCQEYWKYIYTKKEIERFTSGGIAKNDLYYEQGNSLLASLGISGREFFSLLDAMTEGSTKELFFDPGQATMLACLQSDILRLQERRCDPHAFSSVAPDRDRSIQIHCCHSPLREVEVLYDNLLALFETDRTLMPRDIVVMTPDIATYAPLIQAVFDAPEDPSKQIPYTIADISLRMESGIATVLLSLLRIERNRFRISAVLDILTNPAVRERFGLSEDDLQLIRQWSIEAGICWGIDALYREALNLPPLQENTWRFGLDRLLLGYSMPEQEGKLFYGLRPCGDAEGEAAKVLGSFVEFIETLIACSRRLERPKPARAWADEIGSMLDHFFTVNETTEHDLAEIRAILTDEGLAGFAEAAGFDELLSREVVYTYLEQRLSARIRHRGFLTQGVTFCTLLPMRSIPFRVVYLLGMNDGQFPRTEQKLGFDLTEYRRRLCDRSKRHEDRYLFLEALLSARQYFIISYVGRNIKDNTIIPPSVVVCELEDYLKQGFGETALQQVITEHPLQPFSPKYFSGNPKLFSYSEINYRAASVLAGGQPRSRSFFTTPLPPPSSETFRAVSVEQFCRFFMNPCEFLIRFRLNTALRIAEDPEPSDREPFEPDFWDKYLIRQKVVDACLRGHDVTEFYRYVKASGTLPPGTQSESFYCKLAREAELLAGKAHQYIQGAEEERRDIKLSLDDPTLIIEGTIANVYREQQLLIRCGRRSARDLLRAWIRHLLLQASGQRIATILLDRDGTVSYAALERSTALQHLKTLAELFICGLTQPLPFFPNTSFAFAENLMTTGSQKHAYKEARKKWNPTYMSQGEREDVYIQTCFGVDIPEGDLFKQCSLSVFKPLLEQMNSEV